MSTWGIICPGPSLDLYKMQSKICQDGLEVLVAVNGAILLDFRFDFWAVQDIEVLENVYQRWQTVNRSPETALWCPDRWLQDIPSDYQYLELFTSKFKLREFPSKTVADFNLSMPIGKYINWREYTVFMAIALAIKENAKTIFLYGAGMSGKGYCVKGLENYRTQHTERRWSDEALKLKQIIELCHAAGITFIRRMCPNERPD